MRNRQWGLREDLQGSNTIMVPRQRGAGEPREADGVRKMCPTAQSDSVQRVFP